MTPAARLLPVAFLGFVVLGMPGAAEGVAWPSIAVELEQPLGALGRLIAFHIGGYFVASLANGVVTRRLGTGRTVLISGLVGSVALAAYALTPTWELLLVAGVLLGVAGGMIDAASNAHVALNHGARAMGLLHAAFGAGATIGPLIMTWVITGGATRWRWGFAIIGGVQALVTVIFWLTRHRWTAVPPQGDRLSPSELRGAVVLLLGFAVIAGVESAAGAWAFTYLTESLGAGDGVSGLAVTGFFAAFTLGRVVVAIAGDRITAARYLQGGALCAFAGLGLAWWAPVIPIAAVGLLATGLGIAPLFPILMTTTPRVVGMHRASDIVGYELGAAIAGAALFPLLIGTLVDAAGPETIPALLTGFAALQVVLMKVCTPLRTPRQRTPA